MKRIINYYWDDGDVPSIREVREAFNLLYEFCPCLRQEDHPVSKAFHKVVDSRQFTRADWIIVNDYGLLVARSAEERYNLPEWQSAPWRESILQSCARLRGVLVGLENLVKHNPE